MAPAELARAGAIVWVPRGGGQMEIVGHEPALMYDSDDDAVTKITSDAGERVRAAAIARNARGHQRAILDGALHGAGADDRERVPGLTCHATAS